MLALLLGKFYVKKMLIYCQRIRKMTSIKNFTSSTRFYSLFTISKLRNNISFSLFWSAHLALDKVVFAAAVLELLPDQHQLVGTLGLVVKENTVDVQFMDNF